MHDEAFELYRWFLPLLRMDTVPKFVQLIKWVQQELGVGSARVRPPRLELEGDELTDARRKLRQALATRPHLSMTGFAESLGARA
jgi:4-hydroxy-tetrahydrodipicolinate synthase